MYCMTCYGILIGRKHTPLFYDNSTVLVVADVTFVNARLWVWHFRSDV